MHRIDHATATSERLFTEGSAAAAVPATIMTAAWANDVQENIARLIEAAGVALEKGDGTQLTQAVQALAAALVTAHDQSAAAHPDIRAAIAGISVPQATETVAGVIRKSTAAQALAGTDDTTAMSPADVAAAIAAAQKSDQLARNNAAMNAFVSWLAAGRASGPVPGGYLWTFAGDEWTKDGAIYDPVGDCYHNIPSGSVDHAGTIYAGTPSVSGYSTVDTSVVIANGSTVTGIRIYAVVPSTGKIYIVQRTAAGAYTVVASGAFAHTGGGWETFALSYTVPASGTFMPAAYSANFGACCYHTDGRAIKTGEISGSVVMAEDMVSGLAMGYVADATPANMSLSSLPVSLGYVPAKATLYLLHRAVDAVTLNTDVRVAASRQAGWGFATDLIDLGAYSASYKLLRGTVNLSPLASGQSGYAHVETANHKRQHVRAVLAWFE